MSTRDIDVIKQTILQNKIVSSDTISQFMEKCNNNFSAIIEFGGGPVGEKGEKGEDGVPTKPKVPIHVWKEGVDYDFEKEILNNEYKIFDINVDLSDPKYQDGHLILLENAHVYVLELDNTDFQLKPKFLTIFNTYNPYNDLEKNKAYVHIAYADEYYDNGNSDEEIGFITSDELNADNTEPLNKKYIGVYTDNIFEPSQMPNAYNWSKIKGDKGEKGEKGDPLTLMEKTYSELVILKDTSNLIPGMQYKITDFVTTCNISGTDNYNIKTTSANHRFDIIVTADTANTLNADAKVCFNDTDKYFANNKLSEWKIKYDINNDTSKYKWADENGKGVIYYMCDESGNEACYDFKNILFDGKYTFDLCIDTITHTDFSLSSTYCFENKIKGYYDIFSSLQYLNNNLCLTTVRPTALNTIALNIFGTNTYSCIINTSSVSNHIGDFCYNITLGVGCFNNTLGESCYNITLGDNCNNNTFGDNCFSNTFGDNCHGNTFGDNCYRNIFGRYCQYNTFGNNCRYITFSTISGDANCYFKNLNFENGCEYMTLTEDIPVDTTSSSKIVYAQNYVFMNSASGNNSSQTYTVNRGNTYSTKVAKASDGTLKTYCEEDIQNIQTSITYSELVTLKNNSNLIPGIQYRITDFVTTCNQSGSTNGVITYSAKHRFDIIVTADTANTLNADAKVCFNDTDEYFLNNKLSEWKIKYDINNDTSKYKWADRNGKGVIYYMCDESGNEACYDFKNILFDIPIDGAYYGGQYTFNYVDNSENSYDYSLKTQYCYENKIKGYYENNILTLNGNIFDTNFNWKSNISNNKLGINCYKNTFSDNCRNNTFGVSCSNNTFGSGCSDNTFGDGCLNNTFGFRCQNNTFGDGCLNNTFGDSCLNNTFGVSFSNNTFGVSCSYNTFENICTYNTFGSNCQNNKFGNGCLNNSFGNTCQNNTFGINCQNNTFGNSCSYNTFGFRCNYNTFKTICYSNKFGNGCQYNTFGNYYKNINFDNECSYINIIIDDDNNLYVQNYIFESVSTGTPGDFKNYPVTRNNKYTTKVSKTSSGVTKIYCEEDVMIDVDYESLVRMVNNNGLFPGQQYHITDYITTCNSQGAYNSSFRTSSANHQFDIIVTANTTNTLNADARVCLHEFEDQTSNEDSESNEDLEYFLNNKLSEWKIKYDINNDTSKYKWADTENGKGVIYWMQDEFGNEACYDFKNIIFRQLYDNVIFNKNDFYYTFTYIDNNSRITDYSLLNKCNNNIIKKHTNDNIQYINMISINCDSLYPKCENNTFDINCNNILIGGQSFGNTFGMGCEQITIGYSNAYNTFKNYCLNIHLSSGCENNFFDTNVENITLSILCSHNTFGTQSGKYGPIEFNKNSSRNKIGSFCYDISIGNNCNNNNIANGVNKLTLTSKCENNIFGYKCSNIILGDNCNFNIFGNKCEYIDFLHDNYVGNISYIHVSDGISGTEIAKIPTKEEAEYLMDIINGRTINISLNSNQELVYYFEADLATNLGKPLS